MNPLIRPLQTEKATTLGKAGKYLFVVRKDANKVEIKKAFSAFYHEMPKRVNILKTPKKTKLVGRGRSSVKRQAVKKALVTLKAGKTIDIFKVKETR